MHELITWSAAMLIAAGIVALAWSRQRPHQHVMLCPGPRRTVAWLRPDRWFTVRGCRYDLAGLPITDGGVRRCPECGTTVTPRALVMTPRRWRPARVGAFLLLTGVTLQVVTVLQSGRWEAALPSAAFVLLEHVAPTDRFMDLHRESARRVGEGDMTGWQARVLAQALTRDLRADDEPRNATRAMDLLRELGDDAIALLEQALESPDRQQAALAARLLRGMKDYPPTPRLLEVTVQDLRVYRSWNGSMDYLVRHRAIVEPHLSRGLESDDPRVRVMSACIATINRHTDLLDRAVPILVEHLRDNDIAYDASRAERALRVWGEAARPWLEPLADSDDVQQRRLVRELLARLGN